ncbi:MAG: NAD(P)/FAD-dependent oxidoreductase [Candidatus Omnitrophica bacterium]|nr:NAD(P)/FAD-dependent oxidoreductase [Candidatus Omnitrophota bacterium]
MYDVAVIGAGPTGSYLAYQTQKAGFKTIVIEEHPCIGEPSFCAGIVGKEVFERLSIPEDSVQSRINSLTIYSPNGESANLTAKNTSAFILNRVNFDRQLAHLAMDEGASFLMSTRCTDISVGNGGVKIKLTTSPITETEIKAKTCVLAVGAYYGLHKKLGLSVPKNFLDCSQTEVEIKEPLKHIEIYLGNDIAPGSFAWVVPVDSNRARIGVSTRRNSLFYLLNLLSKRQIKNRIKDKKPILRRRIIPIDTIDKTYLERVLVIGDSAGQVKPVTGGGIFYGLLCARLASETILSAFKKEDFSQRFFKTYELRWKKLIGLELKVGRFVRRFMNSLTDENLHSLVVTFRKDTKIKNILEKYQAFDWHKDVILSLLRTPSLSAKIYKRLLWNIFNKEDTYA